MSDNSFEKSQLKRRKHIHILDIILTVILFILLFIMFYKSPLRLDDLTWGGDIGLARLKSGFSGYNGRYLGNVIVIILTRLPVYVRVLFELCIIGIFIYLTYCILQKNKSALMFFTCLFAAMPLTISSQTITWVAGFSNYMTAALSTVYLVQIAFFVMGLTEQNEKKAYRIMISILFVFAGQLLLETETIYAVVLFSFSFIYVLFRFRKISPFSILYVGISLFGAFMMFQNSTYHDAAAGNGKTYKEIDVSGNVGALIHKWWLTYINDIVPSWIRNNHLINIILIICLLCLILGIKRLLIRKLLGGAGIFFLATFVYDLLDPEWTNRFLHGKSFYGLIAIIYVLFIICAVYFSVDNGKARWRLMIITGSQFILAGPLIIVSPINARCFFQTYLFWIMLIAGIVAQIDWGKYAQEASKCRDFITKASYGLIIFILLFMLYGQSTSWHIQDVRMELIEECLSSDSTELVLPNVPYSGLYCYGANIGNDNIYWLNNYKAYYHIPETVNLTFEDLDVY